MAGEDSKSMVARLMALGCPYLESMEDTVVSKVILTRGEARVRVLYWLLDIFQRDMPLSHISPVSMDTRTLTSHFANVGLCTEDNVALVEGTTTLDQQYRFLESLLDLVEAVISNEGSKLEGSCKFADTLCASEKLDSDVFAHSVDLLPADIVQVDHQNTRSVTLESLKSETDKMTVLLHDKEVELNSLLQQRHYEEVDPVMLKSYVKTLGVSLSTLSQLMTNFCQSYETDIRPWLGVVEPPTVGTLGPLCQRTATKWTKISKLLTSLKQLETTMQRLENIEADSSCAHNPPYQKAQETLQQCIDLVST